jgi:hypothetical protein
MKSRRIVRCMNSLLNSGGTDRQLHRSELIEPVYEYGDKKTLRVLLCNSADPADRQIGGNPYAFLHEFAIHATLCAAITLAPGRPRNPTFQ